MTPVRGGGDLLGLTSHNQPVSEVRHERYQYTPRRKKHPHNKSGGRSAMNRLLRRPEAAEYLGMSPRSFDVLVKPSVPYVLIGQTGHRYDAQDLDAWIKKQPKVASVAVMPARKPVRQRPRKEKTDGGLKPKGLKLRGSVWWIDKTVWVGDERRQLRESTGCKDLESAIRALNQRSITPCLESVKPGQFDRKAFAKWVKRLRRSCISNSRGRPFDLTEEAIWQMAERSNCQCEVSGIPLDLSKTAQGSKMPFSPSIDRIDSSKGYVIENCRLVCTIVNLNPIERSQLLQLLNERFNPQQALA